MSTKAFTAQTFAWLRLLKGDRDLTALAVGVQLTEHFNEGEEGGVAYPGSDYIAEQLGVSQSTVVRALHRMHDRGRIRVEWGKPGRGCSNRIWMIVKHAPEHVSEGEKHAPARRRKHAPEENKTCAGAYESLLNHTGAAKAAPRSGERDGALARSKPSGAEAALTAAAPVEAIPPERPPAPRDRKRSDGEEAEGPPAAISSLAQERAWRELREAWARPWADDVRADRRAFERASREVAPEDILAAAVTWVQAADAPRYLQPLAKWLDGRGWEKPPPAKRKAGGRRNGGGKPDMLNEFLEIARMKEAERAACGAAP